MWGLYTLGFESEANDFFYFVADVAEGEANLPVMYAIDGERELTEEVLDHLTGYDGASPGTDRQRRLPSGPAQRARRVVGLRVSARPLARVPPERVWPTLRRQVERALSEWREPDHGIWEVRGAPRHFTSS